MEDSMREMCGERMRWKQRLGGLIQKERQTRRKQTGSNEVELLENCSWVASELQSCHAEGGLCGISERSQARWARQLL